MPRQKPSSRTPRKKKLLLESFEDRILCSAAALVGPEEAPVASPEVAHTAENPVLDQVDPAASGAATEGLSDQQRAAIQAVVRDSTEKIFFEKNVGQFDEGVRYGFKTAFGSMMVLDDSLRISTNQKDLATGNVGVHVVDITFPGSGNDWQIVPGESSGVAGSYQLNGTMLAPEIFTEITLEGVFNGVDLRLYSAENGLLEFDWLVAKAQDYSQIRMVATGQDGVIFNEDGSATLDLRFQDLALKIPEVYQVIDGAKHAVGARMVAGEMAGEIQYELSGNIFADEPLVIDPSVAWSTYFDLDMTFDAYVFAAAVNANGVYAMGWAGAVVTNAANGTYMQVPAGFSQGTLANQDYIYRLDSTGTNITAWTSTLVVSSTGTVSNQTLADQASDLELFPDGRVLAAFTSGRVQIYSANLATQQYSFEPVTVEVLNSVAIVSNDVFYTSGRVNSALATVPMTGGDSTFAGGTEGYIIRFSGAATAAGTSGLTSNWGTYVGGDNLEYFTAISITPDKSKIVFATVSVVGAGYAGLVNAVDSTLGAAATYEILTGVFNEQATPAAFNVFAYFGGSGNEGSVVGTADRAAVQVTANNTEYFIAGNTNSTDLPAVTAGTGGVGNGAQTVNGGGTFDMFAAIIPLTGSAGSGYQATYLGGTGEDNIGGIAYDSRAGKLLVFGTSNGGFPTTNTTPAGSLFYQGAIGGGLDIVVTTLSGNLQTKEFATYIGGTSNDYLGQTGELIGQGHIVYSDVTGLAYLATTVHSVLPGSVMGLVPGKDKTKSNGINDSHFIIAFNANTHDFGDAPTSYDGGSAPSEAVTIQLFLGTTVDAEAAPFTSANATGDDLTNSGASDDEDALSTVNPLYLGASSYAITIPLTNTNGAAATLRGWIDFDSDGVFEASETASVSVPNGGTSGTLTWSVPTTFTLGQSFMRLRLSDNTLTDNGATGVDERSIGLGNVGEIEDHAIAFDGASLRGTVYRDNDNNGVIGGGETGILGVSLLLTGTDDLGGTVSVTTSTLADGTYAFTGLRPSNGTGYTITETQPAGFLDGIDTIGTPGGTAGNDVFSAITLGVGVAGTANNFGELASTTLPSFTKTLVATSQTSTAGSNLAPGEIATYAITITMGEGTTPNLTISDFVPAGMIEVGNSLVTTVAGSFGLLTANFAGSVPAPTVTGGTASGADVVWTFGSITSTVDGNPANNSFVLLLQLAVLDEAANVSNTVLPNSAQLDVSGDAFGPITSNTVNITLIEPNLNITKTVTATGDAGDAVNYAVNIAHTGTSLAPAFDLTFRDALPAELSSGLTIAGVTVTHSTLGNITSLFEIVGGELRTISGSSFDLALGETVGITFSNTLPVTVEPLQIINSVATLTYTGLNGNLTASGGYNPTGKVDTDRERTYSDSANSPLRITYDPQLTKTIVSTSEPGSVGPAVALVGEVIRYQIQARLVEGTTTGFTLRDALPTGLQFLQNGPITIAYSGVASSTTGLASGTYTNATLDTLVSTSATTDEDTYGDGTDMFFKLGTLVNNDNDAGSEFVTITFNALVLNSATNNTGTVLTNSVSANFAGDGILVAEPNAIKIINPATGSISTLIADLAAATGVSGFVGNSLAYDDVHRQVIFGDGFTQNLYRFDLATETVSSLGSIAAGLAGVVQNNGTFGSYTLNGGATFYNGRYYVIADDDATSTTYTAAHPYNLMLEITLTPDGTGIQSQTIYGGTPAAPNSSWGYELGFDDLGDFVVDPATGLATISSGDFITPGFGVGTVGVTHQNGLYRFDITTPGAGIVSINNVYHNQLSLFEGEYYHNPTYVTSTLNRFAPATDTLLQTITLAQSVTVNDMAYIDGTTFTSADVSITIAEPIVALTAKTLVGATSGDAGDTITWQQTITNSGTAPAYDINILDTLNANVTGASAAIFSATPAALGTDPVAQSVGVAGNTISLTRLDPGQTIVIQLTGTVVAGVFAGSSIPNSASLTSYTTLPGTGTALGANNTTGSLTPGASGALTGEQVFTGSGSVSAAPFLINTPTIDKLTPSDTTYTIGEQVTYDILITLPEGVTQSVVLTDVLPAGLTYVSSSVQVFAGGVLPTTFAGTVPPPVASGGNTIFTFGNITTNADNNASNNQFVFHITAQVTNVLGNQSGTTIINSTALTYSDATLGATTLNDSAGAITIVEPVLTFDKAVAAPTTNLSAGSTAQYTITITNAAASGATSEAFDVLVGDVVPAGLHITSIDSVTLSGGVTTDQGAAITGANTQLIAQYDIPVNGSVTITYSATLQTSVTPSTNYTNSATLSWSSLDGTAAGERTGASPNLQGDGSLNDYRLTDSETVSTGTLLTLDKQVAAGPFTIGQTVPYTLVLTVFDGTTNNVQIADTLPAGLSFVTGSVAVSGQANGYVNEATSVSVVGQNVTVNLGSVVNPNGAGNTVTVTFNARVLDVVGNTNGATFTNTATATGTGVPPSNDTTISTIGEPLLQIIKTVDDTAVDLGQTLNFTLTISHTASSTQTAYDLIVRDGLPAGLSGLANIQINGVPVGSSPLVDVNSSTPALLSLDLNQLATSETIVITFTANVGTGAGLVNTNIDNNARIYWDTLAAASSNSVFTGVADGDADRDFGVTGGTEVFNATTDDAQDTERVTVNGNTISGTVYGDTNASGDLDGAETGINNVAITLTGTTFFGEAITRNTTTDASGAYSFTAVPRGNYTITETQPAGFVDGLESVGTTFGGTVSAALNANTITTLAVPVGSNIGTDYNFGELLAASLSGTTYRDLNNDGLINGVDTTINGVTVALAGTDVFGESVSFSTATAGAGAYAFANLRPGNYTITETQPAGFNDGIDTQGTPGTGTAINDAFQNIALAANTVGIGNNFGELPPSSLSGTVYRDNNNNGAINGGETGIGSITVRLTGTDDLGALVDTTFLTNPDGTYTFSNLRPGTYAVSEDTQPAGFLDGTDTQGTSGGTPGAIGSDNINAITIPAGTIATGYNFGELNPASLSGNVYGDLDGDGALDAFESGIAGVTVTLTGTNDLGAITPVVVTTGAGGAYSFSDLRPGTYAITETQPADYADGADTVGTGLTAPNSAGVAGADTLTGISFASVAAGNNSGVNYNFGESPIFGVAKSLEATNDAGTAGANLAIGEIATFRLVATIPSGSFTNFQLQDALPAGFQFVNGSALVALVSSGGVLTSSTLSGVGLAQSSVGTPTFVMPDAAVSNNSTTNVDTYASGADVFFKLGNLTNTDTSGATTESVVIEFQAVVVNEAANQAATALANTFSVLIDKDGTGAPDPHGPPSNTITSTITEPVLGVTKLLQTSGTDAGDAVQYIITITNAAANNAAAYDINVLDALDSDILLNNVTLGNGVVVNGANVNSNTSTTSNLNLVLDTLAAGASVTITLNATVAAAAPAGSTVSNGTSIAWTSTPGVNGNERTGTGGLNDYTASATSADFTLAVPTVDKQTPADTTYSIGETVSYDILVTLPEGVTRDLAISDNLPAGLTFVSVVVDTAAFAGIVPVPTTTNVGNSYTFTFGNATATGDNNSGNNSFIVRVTAQVANTLANQNAVVLTNTATLAYNDGTNGATTVTDPTPNVDITLVEPVLTLDKTTVGPIANLVAGDTVQYQLVFTNTGNATAHEVSLSDAVPAGLLITSIDSNSFTPGATVDTAAGGVGTANLTGEYTLAPGGSVTILYTATLQTDVTPNTNYTNTATVTFSSVDGTVTGERTGITPNIQGDGSLDDYRLTDTTTVSTAGTFDLNKTAPAGPYGIGERITFTLTLQVISGTTNGVQIADALPAGMTFVPGTVTITPGGGMSVTNGTEATAVTVAGQNVTYNLGTVTNPAGDGDTVTITYEAFAANVAGNQAGTTQTNTATATGTNVTPDIDTEVITLAEPNVSITKATTAIGTDAGDAVQYTITVTNASGVNVLTAYDLRLTDALPANVTFTNLSVAGATIDADATAGNNVDITLASLAPGASATLTINAVVSANAPAGATIATNIGDLTYTSTPGVNPNERNGTGGVNDYSGTANSVGFPLARPTFDKLTPSDTTYSIGEQVTFDILVTLTEGVTTAVSIADVLPAGLTFVSSAVQTSAGGVLANTFSGTVGAPTANGTNTLFTFGDITTAGDNDAANNQFVFSITALVNNVLGNQSGTTFTNSAAFNYTDGTLGAQTLNDSAGAITIVEPRMVLDKGVAPSANLQAGDTVTYTLTFSNLAVDGATATAFDALITDAVPAEILITSIDNVSFLGGVTQDSAVSVTGGGAGLTGQFDIPVDGTVTITYTGLLQTSVNPGASYTNTATLTFTSINGVDPNERTGITPNLQGDGSVDDYRLTDTAVISTTNTFILDKTAPVGPIAVGDTVPYTLTLTVIEGTTLNVQIVDTLPAGLQFTAGSVVVTPGVGMSTGFGSEGASVSVVGQNVTFNLGTIVNPASDGSTVTITFNVLVLDDAANTATTAIGETKTNSATATGTGVPPSIGTRDVQFVEPRLVVTKGVDDLTPDINQVVTYTVNVAHAATSGGTAYDIRVRDLLPAGLDLDEATLTITSGTATINAGSNLSAGNLLDFTLDQLALGESVTFTYQGRVVNALSTVGTSQDNNVRLYWDTQAADEATNIILDGGADGTPDRDYGATPGYTELETPLVDDDAQDTVTLSVNTNSVAGTVYLDNDSNGTFSAGDTTLDTDVRLTGTTTSGLAVDITLTTVGGAYNFTNLPAGIYTLTETQPLGTTDGLETIGTDFGGAALISDLVGSNTIRDLTIPTQGSTIATGYNFGETLASSLAGQVYRDFSNDGTVDLGELGINGVTVTLTGTDIYGVTVNETRVTAGDGNYLFNSIDGLAEGLRPGNYTITEIAGAALAPYFDGTDTVGTAGGVNAGVAPEFDAFALTLVQGTTGTGYTFGELDPASISGSAYVDFNNDGARGTNEPGINNVSIRLTGTDDRLNPVDITLVTDATGAYSFTGLRPGNYSVTEPAQPNGYADGIDSVGTGLVGGGNNVGTAGNDTITGINIVNVAPGNNAGVDYNFGELYAPEITKSVAATSEAFTGPVLGTERVALGEIVRYHLVVQAVDSSLTGFTIREVLPAGMQFINDGTATLALVSNGGLTSSFGFGGSQVVGGSSAVTPTFQISGGNISSDLANTADTYGSGGTVYFHLGDIANADSDADSEYFIIEFNAGVLNETGNQAGTTLSNTFDVLFDLDGSSTTDDTELAASLAAPLDVVVAESNLAISKSLVSSTTPTDAGDTVTYRITLTNNASGNDATTAFDIRMLDLLDGIGAGNIGADLELIDTTIGSGILITTPGGTTLTLNSSTTSQLDLVFDQLNAGETVTVDIVTRIIATTAAGSTLTNSVTAHYTSLPGDGSSLTVITNNGTISTAPGISDQRGGSDILAPTDNSGPANNAILNNYAVGATIPVGDVLITDTPTIDKQFGTTSEAGTVGTDVAIGELVTFNIIITLPEGTTQDVVITDTMQAGFALISSALDFTGSGVVPFVLGVPGLVGGASSGTQVMYSLGTLTNAADNNLANNSFTLTVTVRIADIASNFAGVIRSNAAELQFTTPDGPTIVSVPDPNGDPSVTIVEPQLQIVKSADDTTPDIDQVVTYTLVINHTAAGSSDAYDVRIRDLIPHGVGTGLILDTASITVDGLAAAVSPLVASNVTAGDQLDLTLHQVLVGETITITYQVRVENTLANIGTLADNNARLYWDSIAADEADNAVFNDNTLDLTPDRDYGATPGVIEAFDADVDPAQDGERITINTNTITGIVYRDADTSGDFSLGDEPLDGVTVRLVGTTNSGLAVDMTTTTVNGDYAFAGLSAGTYAITETQPAELTDGVETAGVTFGGAVSNVLNDDTISAILIPDQSATTGADYNFGEVTPASIAGSVYHDLDNDGVRDALEIGLVSSVQLTGTDVYGQAVDITLPVADDVISDGRFLFNNLGNGLRPGTYTLTQLVQPAGYLDAKETAGTALGTADSLAETISAIPLGQGVNATDYLFGEVLPSSLAGAVYVDASNDGVLDAGETSIPGVLITLSGFDDRGNPVSDTFTTLADGTYSFGGLRPGNYTLTEAQPAAYNDGMETVGTLGGSVGADLISNITTTSGDSGTGYNFGERSTTITGTVFRDLDRAGDLDAGDDTGLGGVTITLRDNLGAIVATTTTLADGTYQFTALAAGEYTIEETQPLGYGSSTANILTVTVPVGGLTNQNFGETLSTLAGRVFQDGNNDGLLNGTDSGIGGVTIRITGTAATGAAVDRTTTTSFDGTYSFGDLLSGTYAVRETQPTTFNDGIDTAGSLNGTVGNDFISNIVMPVATDATAYNFAEIVPPVAPGTGAIRGTVFRDADRDGTLEAGDAGIGSVTLELLNASGTVVGTTTTSADGRYAFTGLLPATYSVRETQPNGYGSSTPNLIAAIPVVANQTVINQNFGETTSGLSGRVFTDLDQDGVLTAGEPGISGVTLTLSGTNVNGLAVTGTTISDEFGNYSFDGLIAGTYRVDETQPANRIDGLDAVGTSGGTAENDVLRNIALAADTLATGYNFGELLPSVSGTVFRDDNLSGAINGTEPGIGNVALTLRDNLGNVIAATTTNPDGTYAFTNVLPGNYTITETQPDGYGSSTVNVLNVPVSTTNIVGQNFGETTGSLAGTVYRDVTAPNTLTVGDIGLGGVIIRLTGTDAQGTVIDTTTTTNPDGTYLFSGLLGGTYFIDETQPTGFTDGAETVGTAGGDGNTNDRIADIGLGNGVNATGYNFGETLTPSPGTGAVTGTVWLDRDRDGILDAGETGVSNVTLDLVDDLNAIVGTTTTGPDGRYIFTNIAPGIYSVVEAQPLGYGSSTLNTIGAVVVGADAVLENNNFGETLGSLAGTVYRDANNDGVQLGAGETGIAGVTITLSGLDVNNAPVNRTVLTDANGDYLFTDLVQSDLNGYTITETQPAAFTDGLDALGSAGGTLNNDALSNIVLTVTGDTVTDATEYNFGERGTTLSGNVWVDRDRDGLREIGTEPNGILGVLITLLDSNDDIVATTTTNAAGDYSFSNVAAGDYTIVETQPNGYGSSTMNVLNVTVPNGGLVDQNFGETVSIVAGQVFRDDAQDSILNGADRGIEGVQIRLTGTDARGAAVNLLTTTDADGNYVFIDLLAGNYTVTETQPADYRDFTDLVGSVGGLVLTNDRISSIGLGAAVDATDYDFAEIFRYDPTKTIVGTNNPGTSGNNLSIGETVRFRLILALPDGTLNDVVLEEFLPRGLTFLNDGTAAVAFFSGTGTGLTSTTLSGVGLGTTDLAFEPTFLLSDAQISSSLAANEDIYRSGTDVFFKLGNITNSETAVGDTEREFIILEFNARIGNEAANQNGRTMDNTFAPRFDLNGNGTSDPLPADLVSPPTRTVVAEPILALDKQITAGPKAPKPGAVITFTVTIGHAAGSSATAWESLFSDTLPSGMTVVNISTQGKGGAVVTKAASANGLSISGQFDIPVGGSVTITYQVRIGANVKPGTTLTNGADITWTSMPGDVPTERKSGDSLLNKGGINDYELIANKSVKISAPAPTGTPFFWDGFNRLGYPGGDRNDSPYPIIPSDNDMYRLPILPLQPIYSGEADPGSTLVLTMFNTKGETIGTQTVVVDSGGNWLATFPSTTIRDYPNTVQISQLSAYYSLGSGVGHNLRAYYSPALNAGHFFFSTLFTADYADEAPLLADRQFANPINDGAVKYHGEVLSSQGAARGY